ncbi:PREDICTED: serine/threonine-protein kinase DCLK1 [Dufourea novaeangliae]|uniref:serine/threonine-protein kinase DCLK1 n=1 Tax=Dufourea novaeangliae TaxID=178035 RepID=UPI000767C5FF|nr:PREDICTED: serine/threonine-protein kinase DCLK1 [Dufourea novaeangliae]
MMEEPLNQAASPSGDSNFSGSGEINTPTIVTLDERLLEINTRHSLNVLRTPPTKKAKRVRFFRNGDKFYTGIVMAVTPERYRNFDSLASDLTRALLSSVTLPNGVRAIYTMDGQKVQNINDLEDGKCYVVSGQGEIFKKVEYSSTKVRRGSSLSGLPQSPAGTGRQISAIPLCVKARIITLIRHGTKPRKVVRLLLNKRNAPSLEHAMEAITDAVKLDSGAVRKVYTLSGQQINSLEQFFEGDDIFVAYGPEKASQEDFELDFEESKSVQSFRRYLWSSKRQSGPMPRMPRKSGKKVLTTPQVRPPSPFTLILPQPLRLHYTVGRVIGDGNFAIVRHCTHKSTAAEYAMKIVDKYKCQGKETMLASEVAILRQVCHPNIISLIAEQETADQLFLVMELVKGGDLFDAIAAATKFSEAEASVMIGHLTSALAYLHIHHIVHRDVKPENLLVEMDGSHVRCLKLGDFGLAQVVREPLYTVCGTPTYVAPEILAETGYGLKIDVWAAGVILYILLCGFPPFVSPENEQEELFERILSGQYEFTSPYWDNVSDSAKQLISNMLQAQPELRFTAEDVLDHPWLASFLGGEQTTVSTPTNPSEQHWNQQCKPIRVATFEFDFKNQLQHGSSHDEIDGILDSKESKWNEVSSSVESESIESQHTVGRDRRNFTLNECDFNNGNRSDDEPVSLSADCLQDIHTLSQSMNNLINNLNEKQVHEYRLKSSNSETSSRSSIPENPMLIRCYQNTTAVQITVNCDTTPVEENIYSFNERNSCSEINSSVQSTLDISTNSNVCTCETPKSVNLSINKQKYRRKHLYENLILSDNIAPKLENDDMKNCNMILSSTCSSTGSSSNDIETSDSFVNIQFAQLTQEQRSSSTQSMESTDSFENICFSYNREPKNDNMRDPNENGSVNEHSHLKTSSLTNQDKSATKILQTPTALKMIASKGSKTQNLLNNKKTLTKTPDESKYTKNDVKLRREKCTPKSITDSGTTVKNKRFSCFLPSSTKKTPESVLVSDKLTSVTTRISRKFSSTDELRDEKQKPTVKSKRFSLYYTPQPSRKNYESDMKAARSACKNVSANRGDRQSNGRALEVNRKKENGSELDEQSTVKSRRSVMDSTVVATRSKPIKQSAHVRSTVNPTVTTSRTK